MAYGGVPERLKGADCKSAGEAFGGSNPPPTIRSAGIAQLARASAFQAEGRGFETRLPLQFSYSCSAHVAQSAEHFLGKEEVTGSSPVVGSEIWKNDE